MGGQPSPFTNAFDGAQLNSLRYNISQAGSPIPIIYGIQRVSINLIEYWGFVGTGTTSSSGGKGGITKGSNAKFSVNIALALCQGPVSIAGSPFGFAGVNRVWSNGTSVSANDPKLHLTFYAGTDGQAPDPVFVSSDPNTPVQNYSGLAYLTSTPMQLGSSPAIPELSVEITGFLTGTRSGPGFPADVNPADIITDILTNSRYGAGFPLANIDTTTFNDYANYCQATQLLMSLLMDRQQPAARWLEEICQLSIAAPFFSGTTLKIVPYSDMNESNNGASWTPNLTPSYSLTDDDLIATPDGEDPIVATRSDPAQATNWLSLEYENAGNSYNPDVVPMFDQGRIDQFGVRTEPSIQAHEFTGVTQAAVSALRILNRRVGVRNTYAFSLGWRFSRLDPMDIIALTDPTLGLNATPVRIISIDEGEDGAMSIKAEELPHDPGVSYSIQGTAGIPLDFLADPGNANSPIIFEPPAGLTGGQLQVWLVTSGGNTTVTTSTATASGNVLHFASVPAIIRVGNVVTDQTTTGVIPAGTTVIGTTTTTVTLSNNVTAGGVLNGDTIAFFNSDWGGAQVWLSTDGVTYPTLVGTVSTGSRQGILTATLPSHSDPDTTNTLSVDLTESAGQLLSGSTADADNFITLCYVGGELISYQTATLTSAFHYGLTYLRRGAYGTTIASHSAAAPFARIGTVDLTVVKYTYPSNLVGQTIYFKLVSFNVFGQALQDISTVSAYTHTLTGAGAVGNFSIGFAYPGASPPNGTPILAFTVPQLMTLPAGLTNSVGSARVAATVTTIFNLAVNGGAPFGTVTYTAGSTVAAFAAASPQVLNPGDVLTMTPTRTDATLAQISGYLLATV